MDIRPLNQPQSGQHFNFQVVGGTRPTTIEVHINNKQALTKDCDDPPCHESIFIPHNARGGEVLIIARDTFGNVEQVKLRVTDTDASSGGMMSAAG